MRESSLESLLLLATLFVVHEKHAKAVTLLEGLYDVAPEDERVLRLLGHSLIMEGRHERALEIIRKLLAVSGAAMSGSDMACALRLKASALWRLNRAEEARATLEQSIAHLAQSPARPEPVKGAAPARRGLFG